MQTRTSSRSRTKNSITESNSKSKTRSSSKPSNSTPSTKTNSSSSRTSKTSVKSRPKTEQDETSERRVSKLQSSSSKPDSKSVVRKDPKEARNRDTKKNLLNEKKSKAPPVSTDKVAKSSSKYSSSSKPKIESSKKPKIESSSSSSVSKSKSSRSSVEPSRSSQKKEVKKHDSGQNSSKSVNELRSEAHRKKDVAPVRDAKKSISRKAPIDNVPKDQKRNETREERHKRKESKRKEKDAVQDEKDVNTKSRSKPESKSRRKDVEEENIEDPQKHDIVPPLLDVIPNGGKEPDHGHESEKDNPSEEVAVELENEPKIVSDEPLVTNIDPSHHSLDTVESGHESEKESGMEEVAVELVNEPTVVSDEPQVTNIDPSHHSLDTLESGISMTSPHDLSDDDAEVEESISSRFAEVGSIEESTPPSSSTPYPHASSSFGLVDADLILEEEEKKEKEKKKEEEEQEDDELNYDEDFENYESDFDQDDDDEEEDEDEEEEEDDDEEDEEEEEEEDEEEDDVPAPPRDPEMEAVLRAMREENSRPKQLSFSHVATRPPEHRTPDSALDDTSQVSSEGRPIRPKTSRAIVNFARAKERARGEKTSERLKNRQQLLREMIDFDATSIDLFTQAPESYEAYIAAFGRSNAVQASAQTNDDALSELVQTDVIAMRDKWTQRPIHVAVNDGVLPTPQDYLGVGGDAMDDDDDAAADGYTAYKAIASNSGRLTKFLGAASQVVLTLLEEELTLEESKASAGGGAGQEGESDFGFNKPGIRLGGGVSSLLKGRVCSLIFFCPSDSSIFLSGHGFAGGEEEEDEKREGEEAQGEGKEEKKREEVVVEEEEDVCSPSSAVVSGCLVCLWSVHQPSFPQRILTCQSPPLVTTFSPSRPVVVVAGLRDGSLAAWDLREGAAHHPLMVSLESGLWRRSPPSYITACSARDALEGDAIVALETVGHVDEEEKGEDGEALSHYGSFQVVSLTCSGQLTWWVLVQQELRSARVIDLQNVGVSTDLGAAPWSRITLTRAATISIGKILNSESDDSLGGSNLCYDFKLSGIEAHQLYVATANGSIVNCSRHSIKTHPAFFTTEIEPGTEATSLSVCPHDPHYFLVGGSDGLIRLHCSSSAFPLTTWQAAAVAAPIRRLQWSPSRPCVFYMLDTLGMFHIWDLSAGDIYPVVSVEKGSLIGGELVDFDIAKLAHEEAGPLYAAFASSSGDIGIRAVSSQFVRTSEQGYKDELNRFKCYVNII